MRAPLAIRIHDAHLGIWQENPQDPTFRSDVYEGLLRLMKRRGWKFSADPYVLRHFRSLSQNQRLGELGTLRCAIQISGRAVEVDYWSETALQSNLNGRRYDYDRMRRMHHLDRLRVELEYRRATAWLEAIAPVEVSRSADRDMPALDAIAKSYADSWHKDKVLGRPVCEYDHNRTAADGDLLEHGQTVWFPDSKGRIVRGTAYYNINNMWWVVAGGSLYKEASRSLYGRPPAELRVKRNARARRARLEDELALATRRMQFLRAETLKHILFGEDAAFMIWARDHNAYYRAQYSGYTTDVISAGKYTRAEAEAECRRVPHELSMVDQNGSHTRFDRQAV